jgi:hypothetical protein
MGSLKENIYALSVWIFRGRGPDNPAPFASSQIKFSGSLISDSVSAVRQKP